MSQDAPSRLHRDSDSEPRVPSQKGASFTVGVAIVGWSSRRALAKGQAMRVRLDSPQGADVPSPDQAVEQTRSHLATQQQRWVEQLARDPAAFALLEPQIHLAFNQLADQFVASLLACAAAQQPLADAAKKK